MSRQPGKRSARWAAVLATALGLVLLSVGAQATTLRSASTGSVGSANAGTFLSGYFNLGPDPAADNILRLENPTSANGNLCAMIYVFNSDESMGECCGCLLTPNQLLQDSVKSVLGSGWGFAGGAPSHGVIQVVSALPNLSQQCPVQQAYTTTPKLNGWVTHAQAIGTLMSLTEVPLTDNGIPDTTEASSLITTCAAILGNGSGSGHCNCPRDIEGFTP
jgi:hypothetical protein